MQVLIAAHDFPPARGGIQRYSQNLARAVHSAGAEVVVLAPRTRGLLQEDAGVAYRVIRPALSSVWALRLAAYLFSVVRLRMRNGVQWAVATNWYPFGFILSSASKITKLRYAVVCHGLDVLVWKNRFLHALMVWSLLRARFLISVCQSTKRAMMSQGIPPDVVTVVYPGLTPLEMSPAPKRADEGRNLTMLTVCRLVRKKGVEDAIRSLPATLPHHDLRFLIVGSGPELGPLRALVMELGLSGSVTFLGDVSEQQLADAYASSDVFVLPSKTGAGRADIEGLPIVLLEAQMMGLPIVATRNGGIPEVVLEGKTGLLVCEGDVGGIADAVNSLLADQSEAVRMGKRASRWAGRFRWESVGHRIADLSC